MIIEGDLRPKSEINWAKMELDPITKDPMSMKMGITRIGIGKIIYDTSFSGAQLRIDTRTVDSVENNITRMYVGRADVQRTFLKVVFDPTRPITLDDANRINAASLLAIDLYQMETAWRAAQKIKDTTETFVRNIRRVVPESDIDTLDSIAVAVDRLMRYSKRDYPEEFLRLADKMDALGVVSVEPGVLSGTYINFWSAEHIRETFEEKQEEHPAN